MRRDIAEEIAEGDCNCPPGTDPEECDCADDSAGEELGEMAADGLLTRAASLAPQSFNAEQRTVSVIWSTGAAVERSDWDGPFTEVLDLSRDAVDLSELNGASVLNSHDTRDLANVLGVVENPQTDGREGTARIRFSARAAVQPVMEDVRDGILRSISVGYRVSKWRTERNAAGKRTKTAVRWAPLEISFVAVGADPGAKTRSNRMRTTTTLPQQIRSAAALLGVRGDVVDQLATREGVTIESARAELLEHLRTHQPRVDGRASIVRDQDDGFLARAANAIAFRVHPGKVQLRDDARPWANRRLADIAREALRMDGVSAFGSDADVILRWGSMHTTSDFSNFLAELFNKALLPAYQIAPSGLKTLARRATVADFRSKHVYRDSPMGKLQKVNQHGEYKRVDKSDVKPESYAIATYAAVFGITRQSLVNDDLNVFGDIASQLAIQSAEFENEQLAELLVSNPVMADGNALFSAAHGNLAAPGTAIDENGLTAARLALRMSVNQNGQPISVEPVYLLTSATNETAAQKAIAGVYPPSTDNANVFTDALKLVIDPRLDHLSHQKDWYVFGDVGMTPVLEYSYLNGSEGPQVETRSQFSQGADIDGTEVLCKLDYGCGAIGTIGAYKNPGA